MFTTFTDARSSEGTQRHGIMKIEKRELKDIVLDLLSYKVDHKETES